MATDFGTKLTTTRPRER